MKLLIMALAIWLQDGSSAPAFEFRQINTGLSVEAAAELGVLYRVGQRPPRCQEGEVGSHKLQVCSLSRSFIEGGVAGRPIAAGHVGFDLAGASLFRIHVSATDASTVSAAMTEKFGAPCAAEVQEWRNRLGAVLDNPITTWCLSDGRLSVIGRSDQDPSLAEVRFLADRISEPEKPVVDF